MGDSTLTSTFIPSLTTPSSNLPISRYRREILYSLETSPLLIVIGATGSGKTTQIPQYLVSAGWTNNGQSIAITQPRRLAAITMAARVASEMRSDLGGKVGYSVAFEDRVSAETRVKILDDRMLLREVLVDPLLSRYSVITVDEAHERSLGTDVLLGVLKKIMKRRPELRVIISSATLDAQKMVDFFTSDPSQPRPKPDPNSPPLAQVICIEGRAHPVDILHLTEPTQDYLKYAHDLILRIHAEERAGDILVFLPGHKEILSLHQSLAESMIEYLSDDIQILDLFASSSVETLNYVFSLAPVGIRKVILSTNVAEVSLTIPFVGYVLDTGFVRLRVYDPKTSIAALRTTKISKASAVQRVGRAGRTQPAKCFRLYTESVFNGMAQDTPPKIQRSDLAPTILQMKALGIENIARFAFPSPPPAAAVTRALELLYALGALDEYAKLTRPLGLRMAELGLSPMLGKALLSAPTFGVMKEMLSIAAMCSVDGEVWYESDLKRLDAVRRKFAAEEGDHLTLLNIYEAFVTRGKEQGKWSHENGLNHKTMVKAFSVRKQLARQVERMGLLPDEAPGGLTMNDRESKSEKIRRCLTTGYFAHAARMKADGTFATISGLMVKAHPKSLMFSRKADWVIFREMIETGDKRYIQDVTKIQKNWLFEYSEGFYKRKTQK